MLLKYDDNFWYSPDDPKSRVFLLCSNVYHDNRGIFTEFMNAKLSPQHWVFDLSWVKQMNISYSKPNVVRGCHAQAGRACQGKLVTALTRPIFDIITDARPDSKTFKMTKVYYLNPAVQNKLWVPRGFLHAFMVCPENSAHWEFQDSDCAIFEYMCDNTYAKSREVGVNPMSIVPDAFNRYCDEHGNCGYGGRMTPEIINSIGTSDKDMSLPTANFFFNQMEEAYRSYGLLWYKDSADDEPQPTNDEQNGKPTTDNG